MPIKLNTKGESFANSLIRQGKINTASWSFSSADGNELLGPDGDDWANFGKHHLGIDTEVENEESKAYYRFPFAKDGEIYRAAIIAIKAASAGARGSRKSTKINTIASDMLERINKKLGLEEDDEDLDVDAKMKEHRKGKGKKKKKDSVAMPIRWDTIDAPDWMVEPFKKTKEGYLKGRAVVTNVGVFTYQNADGSLRRELRLPSEVFAGDSIESYKMKPMTNDHPTEAVDATNISQFQVGHLGSAPSGDPAFSDGMPSGVSAFEGKLDFPNGSIPVNDRYHLSIDMVITDPQTIQDVMDGKRELSVGYGVQIKEESGVWMGMAYDAIQENIRCNHVAIVNRARAGDAARIILREDSADALCVGRCEIPQKDQEDSMEFKVIQLDGVEYKAEAEVIKSLHNASKRADDAEVREKTLKEDLSKITADRDNQKDRADQLEKELEKAKSTSVSQEAVDAAVKERLHVIEAAELAKIENTDGMSTQDIKAAVVLSVYKRDDADEQAALKEKLNDKLYLDGRFEGALDTLKAGKETSAENKKKSSQVPNNDSIGDKVAKARKDFDDKVHNAWERE